MKNNKETQRLEWGDIAKGIAILLVVIGHSDYPDYICQAIFLFHMPLFFFLAGYFFNYEKHAQNFKEFFKNSLKRLILPAYLTLLVVYAFKKINLDIILGLVYAIGKPIHEWHIAPIKFATWFLFCLFLVRILLFGFIKIANKFNLPIAINIIITLVLMYCGTIIGQKIILPWSFDIALVALYIAYIGYLTKQLKALDNHKFTWIIVGLAIILGYIDFKFFGLSMNERYYSSIPFISINTAILLSIVVIYISKLIEKLKILYTNIIFKYFGINSIIILIFHGMARCSIGPNMNTLWRLFICIILIEVLAQIPFTKNLYSATSIKNILKN